jgi:putative membrane protein
MTSDASPAERRLHPAAFLVATGEGTVRLVVPLLFGLVISGTSAADGIGYAVVGLLISAVYGFLRWQTTSYWIADGALHLRSGIITPDETTVPAARIASIDELAGPIQRLCGVLSLQVQTAGGGSEAEIVLSAVSRTAAAELRARLGHDAAEPRPAAPVWRLSRAQLVVAAVTGPQLGVLAPVIAGAFAVAQNLGDDETDTILSELPTSSGGWVALVAALVGIALLASLTGAVVAFAGFEVHRDADRLRIRRGLLARRAASIAASRVHGLRVQEGVLPRWLGMCRVHVEVASYRGEAAAATTLLPICRRRDLPAVLAGLLPELRLPDDPPGRPPRQALRSFLGRPVAEGIAGLALAALVASELGAPATVWLAPAVGGIAGAALGLARFRAAGWWLAGDVVGARAHRWVGRTTTLARTRRLERSALRQTVFQRRGRLATARFAVASGHVASAANLDEREARTLVGSLAVAARGAG